MRFAMIIGLVNLLVLAGCGGSSSYDQQSFQKIKDINTKYYDEVMSGGEIIAQRENFNHIITSVKFNDKLLLCMHRKLNKGPNEKACDIRPNL